MSGIELTVFRKAGGPLTKKISLAPDGNIISDGSQCLMARGSAARAPIADIRVLGLLVEGLDPTEAIALGRLRSDLDDQVEVVTKRKLNGAAGVIARTGTYLVYAAGEPAYALGDFDQKGMPASVAARLKELGGFQAALRGVLPELKGTTHLIRASTSAGLYRKDTGQQFPSSGGQHLYIGVANGADIERFLGDLHSRCWLAGLGWFLVGAGGQLLERSIVDRSVGTPERLVFEGPPVLVPPLEQDLAGRRPVAAEGGLLDTSCCRPLSIAEKAELNRLQAVERDRLKPEMAKARQAFIAKRIQPLLDRGVSPARARHMIERQCDHVLHPATVLPFDDPELAGKTVGDVLPDPARFVGETLADPLEGPEYGPCKAMVMRRADGSVWIHSFAHGSGAFDPTLGAYELKLDAKSIEEQLRAADADEIVDLFVRLVLAGDLSSAQLLQLRDFVAERAKVGVKALNDTLQAARQAASAERAREEHDRRLAQRRDTRPQIPVPLPDAPWLPQMEVLDEILPESHWPEPPGRNYEGVVTRLWSRRAPGMHELTEAGADLEEPKNSRLPPPEQLLLTELDEPELAEVVEHHIDYIDDRGRSVHLPSAFVKHYLVRKFDNKLPLIKSIAMLPMMLPNGSLLSGRGLDKKRGIIFRIPEELLSLLPKPEECTTGALARAMSFLCDEWLVDVATDYIGKCVIITKNMTIIERLVLPERPGYITTAGQRGAGKTYEAHMTATALLGHRATAAAWSFNEEERRKALLAYLTTGIPYLVWDNIPRGSIIACQHLERAHTAETYSDRILKESRTATVPSTTIHQFTGNNIATEGDLASRLLEIRLTVDRPDPENREVVHPDPIGWTQANRGKILTALFTLLLGNPRLYNSSPPPAKTRFKDWYHLVGSAVEFAAKQHAEYVDGLIIDPNPDCTPQQINFTTLFHTGEAEDQQASSLACVLSILKSHWSTTMSFTAQQVTTHITAIPETEEGRELKAALENASGRPFKTMPSTSIVTWQLKAIREKPTMVNGELCQLRVLPDGTHLWFRVETVRRRPHDV
jgi:hypothetical protein